MVATFNCRLSQVSGVVIPSKIPPGQKPLKALKTRPLTIGLDSSKRTNICPICGHTSALASSIRAHFVVCVKRNGNPTGARWDDNIVLKPRSRLAKQKPNVSEKGINTAPPLTKKKKQKITRPQEKRDARQRRFRERLATVNGIFTPSKVPPGFAPIRAISDTTSADRKYACPICGEGHKRTYHVQSHFASCAEKNGNPMGARWDDAWRGTVSRVGAVMDTVGEVSKEPQDHEMQDIQPEDYDICAPSWYGSFMACSSFDGYRLDEPSPAASPANELEPYNLNIDNIDPQLLAYPSTSAQPYNISNC